MWIITKRNGCFTLQIGKPRNGNVLFGCPGDRPEISAEPHIRAWDFDKNSVPFHSRSGSASKSWLNLLGSPGITGLELPPHGQHRNQIDYILCSQRWRSSIQSTKIRPGADCGSDHELLIAKFRLKLNKVGKTTRPFRYDLNQIPYDYTVGVRNRFKGLDLIDRVPDELWMEVRVIV